MRLPSPLLALLALLSACAADERFLDLEPVYFAALEVMAPAPRGALPDFERRMDRVADQLLAGDEPDAMEAGRELFYAGFLPHVALHAVEDGYLSAGGDGVARMERSEQLLAQAAALRPTDSRIGTVR